MLTVTDSTSSFLLNEREAIDLELKLNVTFYGHTWRDAIGEPLFEYGTGRVFETLLVSTEQFLFLEMLRTKSSWQECRDLSDIK